MSGQSNLTRKLVAEGCAKGLQTPERTIEAIIAERDALLECLKELKELFRFALLCTSPEIARDGMEWIRKAETVIAKAEGRA
jgi:hypothetical protein